MHTHETDTHAVEYAGGFLFITEKQTGKDYLVRLINQRGQCVTRGQFNDSADKYGVDRACETFKRLSAKTR